MGIGSSTLEPQNRPTPTFQLVGEGAWSKVYLDEKTGEIVKFTRALPSEKYDEWREKRVLDMIKQTFTPKEQMFFPIITCCSSQKNSMHTKIIDVTYLDETDKVRAVELNASEWSFELRTTNKGANFTREEIFALSHNTEKKVELLTAAIDIIAILHRHRIVHGDIHAGNFVHSAEYPLVLIDFGAAKIEGDEKFDEMYKYNHDLLKLLVMLSNFSGVLDVVREKKRTDAMSAQKLYDFLEMGRSNVTPEKIEWQKGIKEFVFMVTGDADAFNPNEQSVKSDVAYTVADIAFRLMFEPIYFKHYLGVRRGNTESEFVYPKAYINEAAILYAFTMWRIGDNPIEVIKAKLIDMCDV
jgi:serine/threonine protein kinase